MCGFWFKYADARMCFCVQHPLLTIAVAHSPAVPVLPWTDEGGAGAGQGRGRTPPRGEATVASIKLFFELVLVFVFFLVSSFPCS